MERRKKFCPHTLFALQTASHDSLAIISAYVQSFDREAVVPLSSSFYWLEKEKYLLYSQVGQDTAPCLQFQCFRRASQGGARSKQGQAMRAADHPSSDKILPN